MAYLRQTISFHILQTLFIYSREQRALGLCEDGSVVNKQLIESLINMGYSQNLAVLALRNANNNITDAVRVIQEQPEMVRVNQAKYINLILGSV